MDILPYGQFADSPYEPIQENIEKYTIYLKQNAGIQPSQKM